MAKPGREPGGGYRAYVLGLLTAVYTLNLVDRGLVALLLQSIKEDLRLSDSQLGLVTGLAFALFYATLGLPIARWADRGDRARISASAIGLWGLAAMGHLLVGSFGHLIAARVCSAVGEAGCKPPTYSLVGDYFPKPAERTRAMAVYWLGSPLGLVLSFTLGGWLNDRFGWRLTFLIMGLPGLVLAALVRLTVRDPRPLAPPGAASSAPSPALGDVAALMWRRRSCRHLSVAIILIFALSYGVAPWEVAFLRRSHGMAVAEVGFWLGLIMSLSGIFGTLLGGFVASRWLAGDERGQLRMSAASVTLVVPAFVLFLLAPGKVLALAALVPFAVAFIFFVAPSFTLLQRLAPARARATVLALIMLLANLLGMGLGPQLVGLLSDAFSARFGAVGLRDALLVMSGLGPWAAWHFHCAARTVAQDLRDAEAEDSGGERPVTVSRDGPATGRLA